MAADDDPGPLDALTAALYGSPAPPGALTAQAVAGLGRYELGAAPLGTAIGALSSEVETLDAAGLSLGGPFMDAKTTWDALNPAEEVSALGAVLRLPDPIADSLKSYPMHPGTAITPPDTNGFVGWVDYYLGQLKSFIDNFYAYWTPTPPLG